MSERILEGYFHSKTAAAAISASQDERIRDLQVKVELSKDRSSLRKSKVVHGEINVGMKISYQSDTPDLSRFWKVVDEKEEELSIADRVRRGYIRIKY